MGGISICYIIVVLLNIAINLALIINYVFWKSNEKKLFNLSHLLVLELKQNFLIFY